MKLTKILLEYPGAFTPAPDHEVRRNQEDWEERKQKEISRKDPNYIIEEYIENGSVGELNFAHYSVDADALTSLPDNFTVNGDLDLSSCDNLLHLPRNLTVNGKLSLYKTNIVALPDDLKANGGIDAYQSKLEHIPDNFTVNGTLDLSYCKNLRVLPKGLVVKGMLILTRTNVKTLPDDISIDRSIWAARSSLQYLPDNFTANVSLDLSTSPNLTHLPKGLVVGDTLSINETDIKTLPNDITVKNIEAKDSDLEEIPDNFTISGTLDLSGSKIKRLPNNLKVGSLYIVDTQVKEIPYNLMVEEIFVCGGTPFSDENTKEEILKMIKDKGGYVGGRLFGGITKLQQLKRDHYRQKKL